MHFMKQKEEEGIIMPYQYYIEYNIGHQISSLWDIPVNNLTLHAFQPNVFYSYVLELLKRLKQLGITKDDMLTGKVGLIYKKVIELTNIRSACPRWKILHLKIMPNYLISFNFKVHYNLLPVRSKFTDFRLDNNSRCPFCNLNFETLFHLMGKCTKLGIVWDLMDELMALMNIDYRFSIKRKHENEFEVMTIKPPGTGFNIVYYLTTIINYHLWKFRNRCVHEGKQFDCKILIGKLIKSIGARNRLQQSPNITDDRKVDRIDFLLNNLIFLYNISFSFDNG